MQSSQTSTVDSAVFGKRNLVVAAGLVPVLELADETALSDLIGRMWICHEHHPVRAGAV